MSCPILVGPREQKTQGEADSNWRYELQAHHKAHASVSRNVADDSRPPPFPHSGYSALARILTLLHDSLLSDLT